MLNGPPGIGKSTLARRYAADHALTLVIDIDSIRTSMGQWETEGESKILARRLAVVMAETHLGAGHDVIIPQLNGQVGMVAMLAEPAAATGAALSEVLLLAGDDPVQRLAARRAELEASGETHPLGTEPPSAGSMARTVEALLDVAAARPATKVIHTVAGAVDEAYASLCAAIITAG